MTDPLSSQELVAQLQSLGRGTAVEHLGITITKVGPRFLEGTMPVDQRTRQPYGVLHGGASVLLAETLGSLAGPIAAGSDRYQCFGIDINANHIRPVSEGLVTGRATALHIGRTTQVWEIRIVDEAERLVCISRLTLAVKEKAANHATI